MELQRTIRKLARVLHARKQAESVHLLLGCCSSHPQTPEPSVNPNDNPDCVFCRIIGGGEMVSVIHETEEIIAFLDIQPLHAGHVLVVPKEHFPDLFSVPEELAARAFAVARRIIPGLRKATGCRAVNLFSPNGADGGQDVFHFHVHLIPVPEGAPFPLQLPDPGAEVPSRSQLDVMAARIGRCIGEEAEVTAPA